MLVSFIFIPLFLYFLKIKKKFLALTKSTAEENGNNLTFLSYVNQLPFLFLAISQSLFNSVFLPFLLIIPFLFHKFTEKRWAFLNFFENTKRDSVLILLHFFIVNLELSILTLFSVCRIFPLVSYWIFVACLIFCLFVFYAFIHHECKEVFPGLILFIKDEAEKSHRSSLAV